MIMIIIITELESPSHRLRKRGLDRLRRPDVTVTVTVPRRHEMPFPCQGRPPGRATAQPGPGPRDRDPAANTFKFQVLGCQSHSESVVCPLAICNHCPRRPVPARLRSVRLPRSEPEPGRPGPDSERQRRLTRSLNHRTRTVTVTVTGVPVARTFTVTSTRLLQA